MMLTYLSISMTQSKWNYEQRKLNVRSELELILAVVHAWGRVITVRPPFIEGEDHE
jgi:hypothetical protein